MLSRRHLVLGSGCVLAAVAARARAEIAPDGFTVLRASATGFDGAVPGPVIRARRGEEVKVRLVNGFDEPVALYWHGVRVPNAMEWHSAPAPNTRDGGPRAAMDSSAPLPIAPGASFDYRFPLTDAGTFWYRAVPRRRQERGLYGALVVAEPTPPPVDQDQLLVFAGRPAEGAGAHRFTLNGAATLDLLVRPNERLRLRFINASVAQVMNARIADHRVVVMALDGEPAEPFTSRDGRVVLGPGNRADVFVDATLAPGAVAPIMLTHDGAEASLARIIYEGSP